jgi:hypothetical protein
MVGKRWHPMMSCKMFLHPLQEMHVFMVCMSRFTFFHHLPFNPHVNELTFCFWLMTFTPWPMSSLLTWLEWTLFHLLHCFMRWSWRWQLKQRRDFIEISTLHMFFSLLPFRSLGVYINKLTIFFIIVLTWHGQERYLEAFFFWFCVHFIGRRC